MKHYVVDEYGCSRIKVADVFPELSESKDEKIRKEIIHYFKCQSKEEPSRKDIHNKWIAWLEKQGGQKPNPYSGTSFEYNGHTWGMCARDNGVEILIDGHIKGRVFTNDSNAKEMFIKALERVEEQNSKGYKLTDCDKKSWWEDFKAYTSCTIEQKTTDKVEPKFHEGEWLCENEPNNYARFIQILEIVNVQGKERYRISRDIHNDEDIVEFDFVEKYYHKFDIQDAKDGDVLMANAPFIFNGNLEGGIGCPGAHCGINTLGKFQIPEDKKHWTGHATTPATKEQRDLLFQKMHEARYEWDAEHKQLNKIEPRHEWSKEDKRIIEDVETWLDTLCEYLGDSSSECIPVIKELISKLKSLRPKSQWKPSDDEMKALANALSLAKSCGEESAFYLRTLYEQLKKLKEE